MAIPPLVEPIDALDDAEASRTARHRVLVGFGDVGQRRLAAAHVAVVGAGGLGSPVLLALAGAGVGTITIVDDDVVEASNLQRQIMHRVADVGARKVDSAVRVAADLSPTTRVRTVCERLTPGNAVDLLAGAHVVIDGTDTFDTREAVAAGCEKLGVPLVWGVVQEFHAQVTIFWSHPPAGVAPVRLADLYPPASMGDLPSCAQVGVLASLCVQTGSLMATETIKLLTGVGEPLIGRLAVIDALRGRVDEVALRGAESHAADVGEVTPADEPTARRILQMDPAQTDAARRAGATLVDVREPHETSTGVIDGSLEIPLGMLLADPALAGPGPVVVVCQVGVRAQRAAHALLAAGVDASVLAGGIEAWNRARRVSA